MATATSSRPRSSSRRTSSTSDGRSYYQVSRFDLDGNFVEIFRHCMEAVESRAAVDFYNANFGDRYRLRRRPIDLSRLPADAFGDWEGGAA